MTTGIRSSGDGSKSYLQVGGTDVVTIGSQGIEAGSYKPGSVVANDLADGALIENSVNGIGYGPGAGGTVTQATSKSTAVTLNKPCGQITMNAASLATGTSATFTLQNSLMVNGDGIIAALTGGAVDRTVYRVEYYPGNGGAQIKVVNGSAGALAEALVIDFKIIKGATS